MKLEDFLISIATDLNDETYTHWTQKQLVSYLNEGLEIVRFFKPEMFSCVTVLPLETGDIQRACDYLYVSDVLGECDKHGNMLSSGLPRRSRAAMRRWTKPIPI